MTAATAKTTTSPERQLAEAAAVQLARRERRTARALLKVERASLVTARQAVQHATDALELEAARAHGTPSASAVRRLSPALQASLGTELVRARHDARAAGRQRLEEELDTHLRAPLLLEEADTAAAFIASAGLTAAWGSAALAAVAAESPLHRVAQKIAPNVERTVATEVAGAFNDERDALLTDFGIHLGPGSGAPHTGHPAPGMFKVWSAVLDARTCDRCFGADGEVVDAHASFKAGAPPLHPNCRCIIEHVLIAKTERIEDIGIDYDLFKQELRDVIREGRIISGRHSLSFVSDSLGAKRSPEVITKRFRDQAYAHKGGDGGAGGNGGGGGGKKPPWNPAGTTGASGTLDQRARLFTQEERRIADRLVSEGNHVVARSENPSIVGPGKKFDAFVNGEPVEFKTPRPNSKGGIMGVLCSSIKGGAQAPSVIVDVRGRGMDEHQARKVIQDGRKDLKNRLQHVRIIGKGFDVTISDLSWP